MSDLGGPTVRYRRLATELRRLRGRSGMTGDHVAEALGWSPSKISRLERGRTGYKLADMEALLDLYEVHGAHREELLSLTQGTYRKTWLESESANLQSRFATYVSMETEAETIWDWEPQVFPGLLQTEGYARSIFEAWQSVVTMSPAEVQRRLDIRLGRQELLVRDPPLALTVVLDESILARQVGDAAIMRGQLGHLLECSERPAIEVRVLPLNGHHPFLTGAFYYIQFAVAEDVAFGDTVCIEELANNRYIEDEDEIYQYRLAFERLLAESLDTRHTQELVQKRMRELWS
jgi:transcriptional regulator with XRE-family HTH domain